MSEWTSGMQEGNNSEIASDPITDLPSHVQAEESVAAPIKINRPKRAPRFFTLIVIIGVLIAGGYSFISKSSTVDNDKIQAKVVLTEQELKDVIKTKKLTVYWAGPLEGAKYTLNAQTPGIVYLKYIPGGASFNDPKIYFRTIGTYAVANAFVVTQNTGLLEGNVGFTNPDGFATFYNLNRPTNIYMGIKKIDIQVEIFDLRADQALALVSVKGQIRRIA